MSGGISVLHVAEVLKGGMGAYLSEVIAHQTRSTTFSAVIGLLPSNDLNEIPREGVQLHTFKRTSSRPLHTMRLAVAMRKLVKQCRPDVVHVHGTWAGVACRLGLLGVRRKPVILYCSHGWAFDRLSSQITNQAIAWAERLQERLCDGIICISRHDFDSAVRQGLNPQKMRLIFNGIADVPSCDDAPYWPNSKRRVLFVGRFDRQKGVDILFDAMKRLKDFHCYAIGDRSVGDAPVPPAPSNVKMTGWLPRATVQAYMRSADVLVVPSRWEGFGLVAVEAMRAGVAIVASAVGGLCDVVDDSCGRLVPPGDAQALSETLRDLTDEDCKRMGSAARARYLELFTSDRMNRELDAFYLESLSSSKQRLG